MLLFGAIVFTFASDRESECVAVQLQAGIRVADNDRRVINPEKKLAGGLMPSRGAFVRRELQNFKGMAVRVLEIKRPNAGSRSDVLWKSLWPSRCLRHLILAQPCISAVHVTRYDGDVLKPTVVAAGIGRHKVPFWRQILSELNELFS